MSSLLPQIAPPSNQVFTKASEVPAGSPFGDWSDADFQRFESLELERTRLAYERRCAHLNETVSEAEADKFAWEHMGLPSCRICLDINVCESGLCWSCQQTLKGLDFAESLEREPCQLCGEPMGKEAGITHASCEDHENMLADLMPGRDDEGDDYEAYDALASTYQTDDQRSGVQFHDDPTIPF